MTNEPVKDDVGKVPPASTAPTPTPADEPKDPRWFWLTVSQYAFVFVVTIIFVWVISSNIKNVSDLADKETARGLITLVITVGTVAIAMMLAITAVVTRDFEKRLAAGKDILTILVGVLGTVVGFYYGASITRTEAGPAAVNTAAISVAAPSFSPEPLQAGVATTLKTKISGGTPPYRYSIRFLPNSIPAVENQETADGEITHQLTAPGQGTDLVVQIEGRDKKDAPISYNKDGTLKTRIP